MHGKRLAWAFAAAASLLFAAPALAQGMMGWYGNGGGASRIAAEEASGKAVWDRLQAKQISCADLRDDDFEVLGDYYMGLMMGSAHAAMDAAMDARLGTSGNTQMHVAMGKRMSGCDASASYPQGGAFPMMGAFGGGMMGWTSGGALPGPIGVMGWTGYGWSWLHVLACVVTIALVWTALILSIIALAKWIGKQKK